MKCRKTRVREGEKKWETSQVLLSTGSRVNLGVAHVHPSKEKIKIGCFGCCNGDQPEPKSVTGQIENRWSGTKQIQTNCREFWWQKWQYFILLINYNLWRKQNTWVPDGNFCLNLLPILHIPRFQFLNNLEKAFHVIIVFYTINTVYTTIFGNIFLLLYKIPFIITNFLNVSYTCQITH